MYCICILLYLIQETAKICKILRFFAPKLASAWNPSNRRLCKKLITICKICDICLLFRDGHFRFFKTRFNIFGKFGWISLEGSGVPSRFAWYNLYVYCIARSSWLDVGPVLEMNRELSNLKTYSKIIYKHIEEKRKQTAE